MANVSSNPAGEGAASDVDASDDDHCTYCGIDLHQTGSHYHCPDCGQECSMMGHYVPSVGHKVCDRAERARLLAEGIKRCGELERHTRKPR